MIPLPRWWSRRRTLRRLKRICREAQIAAKWDSRTEAYRVRAAYVQLGDEIDALWRGRK